MPGKYEMWFILVDILTPIFDSKYIFGPLNMVLMLEFFVVGAFRVELIVKCL